MHIHTPCFVSEWLVIFVCQGYPRRIEMGSFHCAYWKISVIQLKNQLHKADNASPEDRIPYELYTPLIHSLSFLTEVLLAAKFGECYPYHKGGLDMSS